MSQSKSSSSSSSGPYGKSHQEKPFCGVCKNAGKSASEYTNHYYKDHFIPGAAKPFCPVCKNAGKSESEYTNHYTKSSPGPGGVVVCPTILQATCSYCRKVGHFKNNCPVLLEKERSLQKAIVSAPVLLPVEKKSVPPIRNNLFDALSFEDEEEDEEHVVPSSASVPISNKMSYASVLLSVVPLVPHVNHVKKTTSAKVFSKCWADYYSSDEEEED